MPLPWTIDYLPVTIFWVPLTFKLSPTTLFPSPVIKLDWAETILSFPDAILYVFPLIVSANWVLYCAVSFDATSIPFPAVLVADLDKIPLIAIV